MKACLTVWVVLVVCTCLFHASPVQVDFGDYVNGFLVEVENGEEEAKEVARSHGFQIDDKLGNLGLYLFVHDDVPGRSKRSADSHVNRLKDDIRVKFVEQQQILKREKRSITYDKQNELPIREVEDNSVFYRVAQDGLSRKSEFGEDMGYNDEYYPDQWYIRNTGQSGGVPGLDMNVVPAWKRGMTGKGVIVTIMDDGIDHEHPDLKNRYDQRASADFDDKYDRMDDPMPDKRDKSNSHGTRCAGEVAAEADNGICGVGIAHECSIGGIRLLDGKVTDHMEAKALQHENQYVDIYSASWGPTDDGATMEQPREGTVRALADGAQNGRGGKGSIFVWATGNGGDYDDDCSADGYVSNVHTLSVGSLNDRGEMPYFMEVCSSTMIVVPSGGETYPGEQNGEPKIKVVSTDLNGKCTLTFEGTSAAAPLAAGCIALVLQANPELTWRDVQHITVEAARIPNVDDESWKINAANYHTSHKYGFGLMDCGYMVELAQKWKNVPDQQICSTDLQTVNRYISSNQCEIFRIDMSQCHDKTGEQIDQLEHTQINIIMDHTRRGDVQLILKSPKGTVSEMLSPRPRDNSKEGIEFTFTTIHNWGEDPVGTWELQVCDNPGNSSRKNRGKLHSWSLKLYGTAGNRQSREQTHPYTPDKKKRQEIMNNEKKRSLNVDIARENGSPSVNIKESPRHRDFKNGWKGAADRWAGFPSVIQNRGLAVLKKKKTSDRNIKKESGDVDDVNDLLDELADEVEVLIREKNTQNNDVKNRNVDGYVMDDEPDLRNRNNERQNLNEVLEEILDILESED
ncbi:hypothetical protein ScPMuIL_009502 [Solemya velum]